MLDIVFSSFSCPATAEYTVTIGLAGKTYCLSEQLTGVEVPPIDRTVKKGDRIRVEGSLMISEIAKVGCKSAAADYRVLAVIAYGAKCKKPADTWIDLTGDVHVPRAPGSTPSLAQVGCCDVKPLNRVRIRASNHGPHRFSE